MKNLFKNKDSAFDSIIIPIVLFLFGLIILIYKDIIRYALFGFAGISFIYGLFKLLMYYKKPENKKDVLTGVIYLLLGIVIWVFCFFKWSPVQIILRFSLAALFLYTGIIRIIQSFKQKKEFKKIYIVSSSIIIFLAIVLILIDFDISTTGFFISIYAVIETVGFILISKKKADDSKVLEANVLKEIVESNEKGSN